MRLQTNMASGRARNTGGLSRSAENGDASRGREATTAVSLLGRVAIPGGRLHTRSVRSNLRSHQNTHQRTQTPSANFQVNYFSPIRHAKWRPVHSCHLVHRQSCVSLTGPSKNSHPLQSSPAGRYCSSESSRHRSGSAFMATTAAGASALAGTPTLLACQGLCIRLSLLNVR